MIHNKINYKINGSGITQIISPYTNTYFDWNNIIKGYENEDMFRLYISNNKAIILPKRFFKSKEDIMAFKQLISANTDKVKLRDQYFTSLFFLSSKD
ncbi:YcxB family protein [Gracilibacillus timonensis]|uniref:YcxB family protein n=1 Tax=Gracilibacillus timonensis TaxID=1816696 RepID=UPI000826960D